MNEELTCPSCGKQLTERTAFCPFCNSYLTWSDPEPEDDQDTKPMRVPGEEEPTASGAVAVSVETQRVAVTPGTPATFRVTVENGEEIVNQLSVEIRGLDVGSVETNPVSVALMPSSSDTIDVTVRIPADASPPAGEHRVAIVAVGEKGPLAQTSVQLAVSPVSRARWSLRPEVIEGGRRASGAVEVANQGNVPIDVAIEPEDRQSGDLSFTTEPQTLRVEAGTTGAARVTATSSTRKWTGKPVRKPFVVPAPENSGLEPATLNGTFLQKSRIPTPLLILLILLLLAGIAAAVYFLWPGRGEAQVPNVVALPVEDARDEIEEAGLEVGSITIEPAEDASPGTVIGQNPEGGTVVESGGQVDLVVAAPPEAETVQVPDVVGMTSPEAQGELSALGLITGAITGEESDEVEEGRVISQDPPAGTEVSEGSTVSLVVSEGAGMVTLGNLVGLTEDEAIQQLEDAGLAVGEITDEESADGDIGEVIAQDPASGEQVEPGSSVSLTVSIGVTVPNVVGMDVESATAALEDVGLTAGETTEEESEEAPEGEIISQTPGPTEAVSPGTAVDLVVSAGAGRVIASEDFTVPGGGFLSDAVQCPVGTRAVGGGLGVPDGDESGSGLLVRESGPDTISGGEFDVWGVAVANVSASEVTVRVHAICEEIDVTVVGMEYDVAPGDFVREGVSCPEGMNVLGGGAAVIGEGSGDHGTVLQESGPGTVGGGTDAGGSDIWLASVLNRDTAPHTISIDAICTSDVSGRQLIDVEQPLPEATFTFASATCPEGTRIMAGGVISPGGGALSIQQTGAGAALSSDGGDASSWIVAVSNHELSNEDLLVRAVCVGG